MRLTDSDYNPLKDLLNIIPDNVGLTINNTTLALIGAILAKGGVILETYEEVILTLHLIAKEYKIIELESNNLRITKYGQAAL